MKKVLFISVLFILILGSYFQDTTRINTLEKAESLMKEGDYLAALVYLNYNIERTPSVKAYFFRAECLYRQEKYLNSLADLTWIKQNNNHDSEPIFLEAKVSTALKDTIKAISLLDSISLYASDKDNRAKYNTESGRLLMYQKKFKEAVNRFDQVKEGDKLYLATYYKGITLRYWANELEGLTNDSLINEAIQSFDKSISLNKEFADPWYQKSLIYSQLLDEKNCFASINKAIEIEPDNYFYYYIKGNINSNLKYCEEALENYNKAITLNVGSEMIYRSKADLYLKCYNDLVNAEKDINLANHIKNKQRKKHIE